MGQPQEDFSYLLQRLTAGYRRALLANIGWLAALGLGVIVGMAWRLTRLGLPAVWVAGLAGGVGLGLAGWLVVRLRRRWVTAREATARLDHALGLRERLITAAEYAQTSPVPALYPLLLEETRQRLAAAPDVHRGGPRLLDRSGALLAVLLLLLLLWPGRGGLPFLHTTDHRAETTDSRPHTKDQPSETEEGRPDSSNQQQGETPADQPEGQRPGDRRQETGDGWRETREQPSAASHQPSAGRSPQTEDQRAETEDGSQGTEQTTDSRQERQGQEPQTSDRAPQTSDRAPQTADSTRPSDDRRQTTDQRPGQGQQTAPSTPPTEEQGTGDKGGGTKGEGQETRDERQAIASKEQAAQERQSQGALGAHPSPSRRAAGAQSSGEQGEGESVGNQEALRAEIRQLLKEVSGELKQLQVQLSQRDDQPHPEAGTGTDPELYGEAERLAPPAGAPLPLQLRTDAESTERERPGGGVGEPSDEVSEGAPQVAAEPAALSATPGEELSSARQPIPPEYRTVFERLRQQESPQPMEKSR